MPNIKEVKIEPDQYGTVDVRMSMQPFNTFLFKLTVSNKPIAREIPAGISKKTGKPFESFSSYSIKAEHNGKEVYVKLPNKNLADQLELYGLGDLLEITCIPHPKGKSFLLDKKEEVNTEEA